MLLRPRLNPQTILSVLVALAAGLAVAAPSAVPASAAKAEELAPLPGGGWLALEKRSLRLLDAGGTERDRLTLRAQQLDLRPVAGGVLAVLVESDTQRTLAVTVDTTAMTLAQRPLLEPPGYPVEAQCLWRDAQGLTHLFVVGKEGLAEQWLLRGDAPPLSQRQLALPPGVTRCQADDAAGWLYVAEPEMGLWAVRADAEGAPQRHAVALAQPWGRLEGGVATFALLPAGVAVLDGKGRGVHLIERRGATSWVQTQRLPANVRDDAEAMFATVAAGQARLTWRDDRGWTSRQVAWSRTAAAGLAAPLPVVVASAQTAPVSRAGDAADDPAIWVHPSDPARSRILGTNKREGLHVYDLSGRELQRLPIGRLNNVDLRQRVRIGGRERDLAVATHRDDFSLVVFEIDTDGQLTERGRVPTGLQGIYGVCVHAPRAGGLEVFVNDQDGRFLRVALDEQDGRITGRVLQRFAVATQPEGCVADDVAERLFLGEEDRGIWAMSIGPASGYGDRPPMQMVLPVGPVLHADVEGLALYRTASGTLLVASSQGNNSYLVLDAAPPYRVHGAFRIGIAAAEGIDGVSETDGLEVVSLPLGPAYPAGALVVQDGFKRLPSGPQNYKIIDWRQVARVLGIRP
ncbi:MAG: phytase [Aquabacterium sp.]|nr:phytase [Aquabacterium sp.]